MQILFTNLPKENSKVSRQNNNDAPQTYIFEIEISAKCKIKNPFTYTYRESLIYATAFFTYLGMFSVLFSV